MRAIAILDLVRRLLTFEAAESQEQAAVPGAAERVLDGLRLHLSVRIGQEGYRTLLARALALTKARFPHMNAVQVAADGSLVGLRRGTGPDSQGTPGNGGQAGIVEGTDHVEGAVALVAQLLGLLTTFIGEDLTLRMLHTVWPEFDFDDETGGRK